MKKLGLYLFALMIFAACGQSGQQDDKDKKDKAGKDKQEKQKEQDEKDDKNKVKLHFPKPSPYAKVKQMIGVTKVGVEYHRPSVRDRQIWGELVPYGEIWRTGANDATKFWFKNDVTINGKELEAGKYSFLTIPREDDKWTLIFNKKTKIWGTRGYDKENDALRLKVEAKESNHHNEMLTFNFKEVNKNSGHVVLAWKNLKVGFDIETDTEEQVMAMIDKAISKAGKDDWKTYNECADYLIGEEKMLDQAEKWVNKSIEIKENWRNTWTKAELRKAQGKKDEAIKLAEKALKIGKEQAEGDFSYESYLKGNIENWKKAN